MNLFRNSSMSDGSIWSHDIESIEAAAWHDMYKAAPAEYAREHGLGTMRVGHGACLAHGRLIVPEFARIIGVSSLPEVDEAIRWMESNCAPGWALQLPDVPESAETRRAVRARGYAPRGNGWAKFRHAPAAVNLPAVPHLRSVFAQPEDAATFGHLVSAGFGLPESVGEWFAELVGRPDWSVAIAYWDDTPVGCGALYTVDGWAWMGADTTLADFRGRGVQSHLIRARLRRGMELGARQFTAETGQPDAGREAQHTSFSNYVRAGFSPTYVRLNHVRVTAP
jgi:GNAT superfamily N-acetyltransferase